MRKEKPPVTLNDIEEWIEEWEESLRWIARADQYFRKLTKESDECVWSDPHKYDRERYWYYYRRP
jgi:hypothetical protein